MSTEICDRSLVEGELAALDIVEKLKDQTFDITDNKEEQLLDEKVKEYNNILSDKDSIFTIEQMEEAMQKVMELMQVEFQVIISLMKTA